MDGPVWQIFDRNDRLSLAVDAVNERELVGNNDEPVIAKEAAWLLRVYSYKDLLDLAILSQDLLVTKSYLFEAGSFDHREVGCPLV
jgi:hypothetical protein